MRRVLTIRNKLCAGRLGLRKQSATLALVVFLCYLLAVMVNTEIASLSAQKEATANYRVAPGVLDAFKEELESRGLPHRVIYNQDNIPWVDILFLYGKYSIVLTDDVEDYIAHIGGGKIIEGRLPAGSGEVLMNVDIARNNRLQVGDVYASGSISGGAGDLGNLTVVGLLKPANPHWKDSYVLKSPDKGAEDYRETLSVSILLPLRDFDAFIAQQDGLVNQFPPGAVVPQSNFGSAAQMQASRRGFVSIMVILFSLIFAVIAFCTYHTNSSRLYRRAQEFQVLHALGYSKRALLALVGKEILFVNLSGWLLGFLAGTAGAALLNLAIWVPNGTPALFFSPYGFVLSLAGAVFLCLVHILPLCKKNSLLSFKG